MFSWVEPTSWGAIALKTARRAGMTSADADARIAEAERLLIDRACRAGGWNFGNATVMNQDLRPYVPTTALTLLALQDRRDDAAVKRGLAFLEEHWQDEIAAASTGLSLICLDVFGRPVDRLEARCGIMRTSRVVRQLLGVASRSSRFHFAGTQCVQDLSRLGATEVAPYDAAVATCCTPRRPPPRGVVPAPALPASRLSVPARSAVGLFAAPLRRDLATSSAEASPSSARTCATSPCCSTESREYAPGTAINTHPLVVAGAATAFRWRAPSSPAKAWTQTRHRACSRIWPRDHLRSPRPLR
jgi:hypothetical protein